VFASQQHPTLAFIERHLTHLTHLPIPRHPITTLPAEKPASRTRIADLSTAPKPFAMMSLQVVAVLRNYGAGAAAGALHRVRILSPHEFSGCFSILLCPCQSVSPLKLRSYRSQLLLKAMLHLVEEALLNDRILSSTELPEQVVRQHARKRWLRIRGLAIRLHALDAPSLLSVPR
jgi:hypothetical protein